MLKFRLWVLRGTLVSVPVLLLTLGLSGAAKAGTLTRVLSRTVVGEQSTTFDANPGGTGGVDVFTDTFSTHDPIVYVTFFGTGDVHAGPAPANNKLFMTAEVSGNGQQVVCHPFDLAGGAGSPTGWQALLHIPTYSAIAAAKLVGSCNDGGGGPGDCHDNTVAFSCCVNVTPDLIPGSSHVLEVKLGNLDNVNPVFIEKYSVYVDTTPASSKVTCP